MKVKGKNGKEYFLVEVIAHILKYLKDELIKKMKRADWALNATDFDWVITVPAIWRARGKQMMREAGYKAGLCSRECCPALEAAVGRVPEHVLEDHPDKLSLALEPESAAIFCQNMMERQASSFCSPESPYRVASYLIVDIGGGTVDISAHHVVRDPEPHIKVIHPPTGNDCGGTKVNQEFAKFLQSLVKDDGFSRFLCTADEQKNAKNRVYLNELFNENFEKQKMVFSDAHEECSSNMLLIELPTPFIQEYIDDLNEGAGLCSNVSCGKLKEVSERQFIHMPEEENPDKLSLVLEPEAAAFYCQNISAIQRASHCNVKGSFKSDSYVVIDVGGGTVDIVAYQVCKFPEPHMEVLHEPTGGAWGGRRVNLEFKNFLQNLAGDIGFTQYINMASEKRCAKHCAELDEIVEENFEAQKTIFGDNDLNRDAKITVHLNFSFLKTYESELEKKIQDMHIQKIEHATIDDSDLRITYEKVQLFFDPIVDGIIECVAKVFSDVPDAYTVYLVGGFGGCQYIYNKLCARFGEKYKFITPEGRNHAVVKGAAMMKKTPQFLNARRVDATYGIETSIPFENGKHDELYRVPATVEGEPDMCSNIFTTFVEKGDVVSAQDVYMMSFTPERKDQRYMKVMIYTSLEKDVWYTTGKRPSSGESNGTYEDVNMIGELFVPFRAVESDESAEDQIVDVMFDFSGAEIKVTGFHRKSATEVRVVLNFLD
ncbi:Heat shock 70 kDa protein 12A [Geodia barretti]|nr:Heat shock 70 kDa protein 12A [Geodia barretti]